MKRRGKVLGWLTGFSMALGLAIATLFGKQRPRSGDPCPECQVGTLTTDDTCRGCGYGMGS